MDFKCVTVSTSLQAESFEFEWDISQLFGIRTLYSSLIASSLNEGVRFQIVVRRDARHNNVYLEALENRMGIGLRRTDENVCGVRAILLFEIRNSCDKLYFKESLDRQFSKQNDEDICWTFHLPQQNRDIDGMYCKINFKQRIMKMKGKLILQCERENIVPPPRSNTKNIYQLQSDFKDLLLKELYADVKFQIGDSVRQAHKSILCSRSSVFRTMFEQNMKEKETDCVKITDIEMVVFDAFLIFLYTGEVQDDKLDVVMSLYSVADKYAVDTLFETCSSILTENISDTTVAPLLKLADMHSDETLKTAVVDFICKNFSKVARTESWRELLNSDPHLASYTLTEFSDTAAKKAEI